MTIEWEDPDDEGFDALKQIIVEAAAKHHVTIKSVEPNVNDYALVAQLEGARDDLLRCACELNPGWTDIEVDGVWYYLNTPDEGMWRVGDPNKLN